MPDFTTFKGVEHIGEATLCEQLKANLTQYLNWSFLAIGGWNNVELPQSGAYGGRQDILRLVDDPHYSNGAVWESFRKDWVWETGVEYDYQPIPISGIYIDDVYHPNTGDYTVSYPLGRIIFDEPIDTDSEVKLNYSYRYVQVYTNDAPWFEKLQFNSFRVDDPHFLQQGSGNWDVLAQNRVQLPAIVIEPVPRRTLKPLQLGGGQWVYTDVLFHVLAETSWERDKIFDILTYQKDKTILSFNKNKMMDLGEYPLDIDGDLVGDKMYPDLVMDQNLYWKKITFIDSKSEEIRDIKPLYRAKVRTTFEIDMPEI